MVRWGELRRAVEIWDRAAMKLASDAELDAFEASRGIKPLL